MSEKTLFCTGAGGFIGRYVLSRYLEKEDGDLYLLEQGRFRERLASFLYPGGAVAVHSDGRSRDAIWQSLERREVYGTSGPRILLWFDLLGEDGRRPMGSEVVLSDTPRFEARAVGARSHRDGLDGVVGAVHGDGPFIEAGLPARVVGVEESEDAMREAPGQCRGAG